MEKKFLPALFHPGRRCISMRVLSPFFLFFFQLNKQFGVKQLVEFIERKVDKSNKKKRKERPEDKFWDITKSNSMES